MKIFVHSIMMYMYIGSAAGGVKELDNMKYNSEGKAMCGMIETAAEKAQEKMAEEKEAEGGEEEEEENS